MPKTAGTDTQVMRVIQILRRLQGLERGALLLDLLKEHGISRSQIRRDLIALEEAGMPIVIEQEEGRSGRARVRLLEPDSTRSREKDNAEALESGRRRGGWSGGCVQSCVLRH